MGYIKKNQGFTLVELLMGMTILLIIMAAIAPLFSTLLSATSSGLIKNNLLQEGRWAVDMMAKDMSSIDINKITSPAIPTSTTATTASTLSFTPFNSTTIITYSIVNNEVCRQVDTGIKRPLTDANRASAASNALVFTRNTDGISIDIQLTLTKADNKARILTEIIKTTISPLNNGKDN